MKRKFINFWKGIWNVVKSMANWKGVLSLFIVWLLISGAGLILIGVIFTNKWLIGAGTSIYAFWLAPITPLIPINIALALFVQRFVFRDKSISWKVIKQKFKEIGDKK